MMGWKNLKARGGKSDPCLDPSRKARRRGAFFQTRWYQISDWP